MNLQENIRRILREEDFIPLEDLYTVIKDYEDGFDVFIMNKDKKIGEISFAKEDKPNQYTIVDATIDDEYKGNRIYSKTIINLFKERPNIIINSVFRSPEAEKAWKYLLSDLPSNIEHKVKYYEDEETTLYQLKLKNLQESIRRILKEETDSVKNLNESKTSQHLKLMNNLLDPLKKKDCLCDIKISFDVEENYYDIYLVFSQKELHEKFFDVVGIRSYIQKMMNEVKMELESFLPIRNVFIGNYTKPNCEWSPLNESEDKKEKSIESLERSVTKFINMHLEDYDLPEEFYKVAVDVFDSEYGRKECKVTMLFEKPFKMVDSDRLHIIMDIIKKEIKEYFGHTFWYIQLGSSTVEIYNDTKDWYEKRKKNINESKDKNIEKNLKLITKLLDTIDVDGLCEMWVEYNPEDGDYEIRSKTTIRYYDMEDMAEELGYIEDTIRSWKLKTYVFSPYYVENCEDEIEFLNESENKKSGLLRAIEEDGLFQVMQDTGLSMGQIILKYDNLPREVFERFIKDFINEEGYHQTNGVVQLGYEVEILHNIYVNHFYMKGDKVTVEIRGYNDYNEQTDGYIESLSNLTDDEIFNVVDDMTRNIEDNWD
jgi:hypothetical protein